MSRHCRRTDIMECAASHQSGFAPENFTTLAHFSVSSAISFPKSTGEPRTTTPPKSEMRVLNLASARPALTSRFRLSMIFAGVAFGAPRPNQSLASYPGTNSPTAGVFGSDSDGAAVVTANARRLGRDRRMRHHDKRLADHARDWRDVTDKIEVEPLVQCCVDCIRGIYEEECVSVRRGLHDCLSGDVGASAWPVLDDERLAEPLREPLTHQARVNVVRAAGSKSDDDAHRPRRIGLRPCDARNSRQRDSARSQMQE